MINPTDARANTSQKLYVKAYSKRQNASLPSWAAVRLDKPFIDAITKLHNLCSISKLQLPVVDVAPFAWEQPGGERQIMTRQTLVANHESWWFRASLMDTSIETHPANTMDLLAFLKGQAHPSQFTRADGVTIVHDIKDGGQNFAERLAMSGVIHFDELTEAA